MPLAALRPEEIREIAMLSRAMDNTDRPIEYTAADIGGPEWERWQEAKAVVIARIDALPKEARLELVALAWLGRGDSGDDFDALLAHARRSSDGGDSRYLASKAPLHQYLAAGAHRLGVTL